MSNPDAATMTTEPLLPPEPDRPDGNRRRVGVEIEFTGLDAYEAAQLVRDLFHGTVESQDEHRYKVRDTDLGVFTVELDLSAAHPEKPREMGLSKLDQLSRKLRATVGDVGSLIMPFEIACPPIPIDRLGEIDRLVKALRRHGAQGTEGRVYYAFGLHFNPEIPRRDPNLILDYLKAYLLLSPWLREEMAIDFARRVAPFIQRFPDDYADLVLNPAYRPDFDGFIRDYVRHNPSRNRELDLYPLIAELKPDALPGMGRDSLIRPRPTFHWRLPDSRVGEPGWSVIPAWNRWVQVERLAIDRWALDELGALWLDCRRVGAHGDWARVVSRWLPPT